MTTIGPLIVDLKFNTEEFEKDLRQFILSVMAEREADMVKRMHDSATPLLVTKISTCELTGGTEAL